MQQRQQEATISDSVAAKCGKCGGKVTPGAKFCGECGSKIAQ